MRPAEGAAAEVAVAEEEAGEVEGAAAPPGTPAGSTRLRAPRSRPGAHRVLPWRTVAAAAPGRRRSSARSAAAAARKRRAKARPMPPRRRPALPKPARSGHASPSSLLSRSVAIPGPASRRGPSLLSQAHPVSGPFCLRPVDPWPPVGAPRSGPLGAGGSPLGRHALAPQLHAPQLRTPQPPSAFCRAQARLSPAWQARP